MSSYEKLGKILGADAAKLADLDAKMSAISGKTGVMDELVRENDVAVEGVLADLGLSRANSALEIFDALSSRLLEIDKKIPKDFISLALQVFTPPAGLFIKKQKVAELLAKQPPQSLLDHFGYTSVQELLDKEGFASVVAALRFTQTTEWMHQFFDVAYKDLKPEDFEDREVEIKVLDAKWSGIDEKFIGKKLHNVSHLKEFGVIFISPESSQGPGESLRNFLLLLHYLHEVPFYSGLFRKFLHDADFITKLQSLLRGDVPDGPTPSEAVYWRIVQRYLAKDDPADFRLHEAHVDPEAEHWYLVAHNFDKVAELLGDTEKFNLAYWTSLDHIGDFVGDKLVSFDVVDLVMSSVTKGEAKYLYHQQESLWNRIFSGYLGRDKMNQLIEDNIIGGFIKL